MLAFLAAGVLQAASLPEKAVVSYSGIPSVTATDVTIQSHSVTLSIFKDYVDVSSLTLIKNNGPAGVANFKMNFTKAGDAPPATGVKATWTGRPVTLSFGPPSDASGIPSVVGSAPLQNLGTYALRVVYRVPLGKCGFDQKQRLVAYDLTSTVPIGTLMVTYQYAPGVVFHEPEAGPKLGWQIGQKGAFLKLSNYDGQSGLSYCAFYPGGFR